MESNANNNTPLTIPLLADKFIYYKFQNYFLHPNVLFKKKIKKAQTNFFLKQVNLKLLKKLDLKQLIILTNSVM